MNRIHYILALLTVLSVTACIDPFTPDIPPSDNRLVVIQGTIVSDSICPIWVSETNTDIFSDASANDSKTRQAGASDPRLWVEGSDGSRYDGMRTNATAPDGRYTFMVSVGHLNPDETYCVRLDFHSESYQSVPARPEPTPGIESINWSQEPSDSLVSISVTAEAPVSGECYMEWKCVEDWEILANHPVYRYYDPAVGTIVPFDVDVSQGWKHAERLDPLIAASSRYPQNRVTDLLLYTISGRDDRISVIYSTHVIQRALSREEYEYIETEQKQTSGMGGIFTPMPGRLPTNIRCTTSSRKALGFVGVSLNVAHRRLYIEGREVDYERDYPCDEDILLSKSMAECLTFWERGYQNYLWLGGGFGKWMPNMCLDVRARGASLVRPDFWAY